MIEQWSYMVVVYFTHKPGLDRTARHVIWGGAVLNILAMATILSACIKPKPILGWTEIQNNK